MKRQARRRGPDVAGASRSRTPVHTSGNPSPRSSSFSPYPRPDKRLKGCWVPRELAAARLARAGISTARRHFLRAPAPKLLRPSRRDEGRGRVRGSRSRSIASCRSRRCIKPCSTKRSLSQGRRSWRLIRASSFAASQPTPCVSDVRGPSYFRLTMECGAPMAKAASLKTKSRPRGKSSSRSRSATSAALPPRRIDRRRAAGGRPAASRAQGRRDEGRGRLRVFGSGRPGGFDRGDASSFARRGGAPISQGRR